MTDHIHNIHIVTKELDMASVISLNSRENLFAFLKRMDIEVEDNWEKEVLATVLKDTIVENPEYLLFIYNRHLIEFLFELWENEYLELSAYDWAMIGQLKLTGLIDLPYGESLGKGDIQELIIVKEARDAFYFYLKSKSAKIMMNQYDIWEALIRGLIAHYGIVSFQRLYYMFCRLIKSPIDDRELHRFLSVRIDLLQLGGFAFEKSSRVEYYQNYEISNGEQVLEERQKTGKLEYFLPDYDDAIYIAENNGIGSWDGISILAEVFLEKLEFEYYKTVIAIKSTILMIQNNENRTDVEQYLYATFPECIAYEERIKEAVCLLYYSVPVYALKGWSRRKLKRKQSMQPSFTVIRGGKDES